MKPARVELTRSGLAGDRRPWLLRALVLVSFIGFGGAAMPEQEPQLQEGDIGSWEDLSRRPNPEHLALQPVPSLASTLLAFERRKGSPLSKAEVELIRDSATVVAGPAAAAKDVETIRGYADIEPQRAWEQWQALRDRFKQ